MADLPFIHLIYPPDSIQQLGKLHEILQKLKAGKRIGDFRSLEAGSDLSPLKEYRGNNHLVLVMLTSQLEPDRDLIERKLSKLKEKRQDFRIAEILVDNLRYDNRFITLPTDLKPIRSREDKNAAWSNIEQELNDMFPVKKREEPVPKIPGWSKYLKFVGLLLILVVAFIFFKGLLVGKHVAEDCIDPDRVNPEGDCPAVHLPVCGCDGKTYSNACVAANVGLINWEDGACE